ncbi:MAG: OmpA family protein [Symploca sp. SIO2E6]|nr:OmpA family protein [Symploca sp. SIO2E6]
MIQSASSAAQTAPKKSTGRLSWLVTWIFRLLLLGVGGGLAIIVGIVLANFYPSVNPQKPLLLRVIDGWEQGRPVIFGNSNSTPVPDTANPPLQLTPEQKQQAEAELTRLQEQQQVLREAVVNLETQLGISSANETLETRLQSLSQQIQGGANLGTDTSVANGSTNQTSNYSESVSSADKLKVTLPSDALFEVDNSILRPEAGLILDKIIADLRDYSSSTIRIAAYTDGTQEAADNRELSFRRAKAIEQYLANALGDDYRWLVIGYGETLPLVANDNPANQQRNRRIEIAVVD